MNSRPNPLIPPMDPRMMAAQGMANPFAPPPPNAMRPPSKIDPVSGLPVPANTPPPSAAALGLGFQGFAAQQANALKVQNAMTSPFQPLQNSGQQAPQSMPQGGFGWAASHPPEVPQPGAPSAAAMPPGMSAAGSTSPGAFGSASANSPALPPMSSASPPQIPRLDPITRANATGWNPQTTGLSGPMSFAAARPPTQQFASLNPPQTATAAALTPPGGFQQANTTTPVLDALRNPAPSVTAPFSLPSSPPLRMASSAPPVTTTATPGQLQMAADQSLLQQYQKGSGASQVKNPWLRGLAIGGDIAGSMLLGGGMAAIPGSTARNIWLENRQQGRVANDQAAEAADLSQQTGLAGLAKTQAETAAIPITAGLKKQQYLAALAGKGLREDENGTIVPDENSPVYQQQQQQQELIQAHAANFKAGTELKNAQAAFEKTKNDPTSAAFKLAKDRLSVAQQNANAAGQRAQAYMGRYLQSAYNIDAQGNVLPGATEISDEAGNILPVGTGNAALAVKSQANAAMFNEVGNATDVLEQKAESLVKSGGKLNDVRVAAAIKDPETTSGQWLQGEFASSGLTPAQRDYVIAVKAYKERLQPLRKSAGGGVSDSQIERLLAMAPGAATPDLDYLKRQTKEIRALQNNLAAGVTTAKGGLSVKGRGNPMQPPGAVSVTAPDGTVHTFKDQATANQFKKLAGIQ